jgi:hypothetical protein
VRRDAHRSKFASDRSFDTDRNASVGEHADRKFDVRRTRGGLGEDDLEPSVEPGSDQHDRADELAAAGGTDGKGRADEARTPDGDGQAPHRLHPLEGCAQGDQHRHPLGHGALTHARTAVDHDRSIGQRRQRRHEPRGRAPVTQVHADPAAGAARATDDGEFVG